MKQHENVGAGPKDKSQYGTAAKNTKGGNPHAKGSGGPRQSGKCDKHSAKTKGGM